MSNTGSQKQHDNLFGELTNNLKKLKCVVQYPGIPSSVMDNLKDAVEHAVNILEEFYLLEGNKNMKQDKKQKWEKCRQYYEWGVEFLSKMEFESNEMNGSGEVGGSLDFDSFGEQVDSHMTKVQ